MTKMTIQDLSKEIKKTSPYFYLVHGNQSKPIAIRDIEPNILHVDMDEAMAALDKIKGFIVLEEEGILFFEVPFEKPSKKTKVVPLQIDLKQSRILNRRAYKRLEFTIQQPCTLKDEDGECHDAWLRNISADGILIEMKKHISLQQVYQFRTDLSMDHSGVLELPVQFIYKMGLPSKEGTSLFQYGGQFITNPTITHFPVLKESSRQTIIDYVNRSSKELVA